MSKMNETIVRSCKEGEPPPSQLQTEMPEQLVSITDERVARLMIILQGIEAHVKNFDVLSESELSEIVVEAARICGFSDSEEARAAVAAVLQSIHGPQFGGLQD